MQQKILIVDDDPDLRELLMETVADEGFSVEGAVDGQDAMRILSDDYDFAAVVSDVLMPNMDGIQLLEQISTKFPTIPVFIVSGGLTKIEAKEKLGKAVGFFEKPVDISELTISLKKVIF